MSRPPRSSGSTTSRDRRSLTFLADGGEMGARMRDMDWSATPLGPPETWPQSLRSTVSMLLPSKAQIILFWGPDFVVLYNDAYKPVFGAKHPEALGQPGSLAWQEIWHTQLHALLQGVVATGEAFWARDLLFDLERYGFREETYFDVSYDPVRVESGAVGGVFCIVTETTERVVGQRRLALLRELAQQNAVSRTSRDACIKAMDFLSGHPADVAFALVYLDDTLAGSTPQAEERLASANPDHVKTIAIASSQAGGRPGRMVVGINPRRPFDAQYSSFLELVADQLTTALANARMYEEERQRVEALAAIDAAKTVFFSNISHEFRTPLTLMLGPLEDALAVPHLPPEVRTEIEVAERNAKRLLKLVNSLLDFARIEAGRVQASFAPVDLSALTTDLSSSFRSAMERAGLTFTVTCDPPIAPVFVDREMWEKIVLNLLSNAFKFTLRGAVAVRLTYTEDGALLEVADTGIGIPTEEMPRLFERFHRLDNREARTHEGSGIGLALVLELVRLHGGDVTVHSTPGAGTTFRVRVPFGSAHLPPDRIKEASAIASETVGDAYVQEALRWLPGTVPLTAGASSDTFSAGRDERFRSTFGSRILVADDNADMRGYLRDLLSGQYDVDTAADGEEALARAREKRPDLVLADVMMPKIDGFQLLKRLREEDDTHIPLILVSARAGDEARVEGLRAGADDYIVKPFSARELLTRIGALLEITETRREGESRFRAFLQATTDVVYRMSPDWSEMRELQGRSFIADQNPPFKTWLETYIPPGDQPHVTKAIQRAIDTRSPFQLEHRVIRADGSVGWTLSRAIPIENEAGEIVEWFGAATDVTEHHDIQDALRHQREQLEAADRQKNEFLAMLAHELRNPLAPIRNAGELLAHTVPHDARSAGALATVERQVTHLTRLVDDLLDISRITQGRIELRRRPVRLEHVVSQAHEAVEPLMSRRRHRVTIVSTGTSLVVNGDLDRLVQCFGNVLTNAAKYTPPMGSIRVELRKDDGQAVVTVHDNGVGIPNDLLPVVFDLFVQGKRTLDRSQGGLGIGLTIVRRLIEMHGGSVAASSAGAGRGSAFEIRLPLADHDELTTLPPAQKAARPLRILVVDDNQDAGAMLTALLTFDGHVVATAMAGPEALGLIATDKPDVVLMDIGLPGMDGYEIARRIRSMTGGDTIQLVAITGYGRDEDRTRAREAGFAAHLVKPVEFEALRRTLANLATTSA